VCDLETSRIGAPYIYDISNLRVNVNNCVPNFTFYKMHIVLSLPIKTIGLTATKDSVFTYRLQYFMHSNRR